MSDAVDRRVTEAIVQTNVSIVGLAPAMAMASLYQTLGNTIALAAMNAVYAQQQTNMAHQAATARGVALLLSLGS